MKKTFDLGFERPDYGAPVGEKSQPQPPEQMPKKKVYPSLHVDDNQELASAVKAGDEITATVKFRVRRVVHADSDTEGSDQNAPSMYGNGCSVELEARSITFDAKMEEPQERDGKAALDAFFYDKKKKQQAEEGENEDS